MSLAKSTSNKSNSVAINKKSAKSRSEYSPVLRDSDDCQVVVTAKGKGPQDVCDDERKRCIRRPVHYHSINPVGEYRTLHKHDETTIASLNRYKYYSKLAPHGRHSILLMPDHVVPSKFFVFIPVQSEGEQSSIITIFSIWNTMMGTSLLSIPWAMQQAGFATAICITLFMASLTLYTAYLVMRSTRALVGKANILEFSDVCRYYLGKWGELAGILFSVLTLLGAMIVYWVLMSNFLFNTVSYIYDHVTNTSVPATNFNHTGLYPDVVCPNSPQPKPPNASRPILAFILITTNASITVNSLYSEVWDQVKTVPFFMMAVLFPLINFRSPTFFTKFNALGTISIAYIVSFVITKAIKWGIHLEFSGKNHPFTMIHQFQPTFSTLSGTLCLAFFVHNCVLSILRMQKNPENNGRDLSIAYLLVAATYIIVGVLFLSAFPYTKTCIEDNLLNNFSNDDIMAMIARIFLFFQMMTVFPLLTYILRVQILYPIFGSVYPGCLHVIVLNVTLVTICVLFARFLPHIGIIIRFVGAFCGLAYIFCLPCFVYMLERRNAGTLTAPVVVFHVGIICLGVANFIAQFIT